MSIRNYWLNELAIVMEIISNPFSTPAALRGALNEMAFINHKLNSL